MTAHLFVYGTLRPGDVRWHLLEPFVHGDGVDDRVAGSVFDTGLGYPAAKFGGSGSVVGRTFELVFDVHAQALATLDQIEGTVAGFYRRVELTTNSGVGVWAYEYGAGLDLQPIASGDWFDR